MKTSKPRSQVRGFGVVGLLIFIPLLMAGASGVFSTLSIVTEEARRLHHCRETLLKTQMELAESLDQLLELNPSVRKWRLVATSPEASTRAAAQLMLSSLRVRQIFLRTGAKLKVRSITPEPHPGLAVVAVPPHSPFPEYQLIQPFAMHQTLHLRWTTKYENIPEPLKGRCSATLTKRRNQWEGILTEDRSSSKPLSL